MGSRMGNPNQMHYNGPRPSHGIPRGQSEQTIPLRDPMKPASASNGVSAAVQTPGQTPKHQRPQPHQVAINLQQQSPTSMQNGTRLMNGNPNQPLNLQFQYQTPEMKRPRINSEHEVRAGTGEKGLGPQYQSVYYPTTPGGRMNRSSSATSHLPASSVVLENGKPMIPGLRVSVQPVDPRQMVAMTPKNNATESGDNSAPRPSLMEFVTQGKEMIAKGKWDKNRLISTFRDAMTQFILGFRTKQRMAPFDQNQVYRKEVHLPKKPSKQRMKTLIFDMDETLIHCNEDVTIKSDYYVTINYPSGQTRMAGINVRPYAREILKELGKHFEIIVFTAGHSYYAIPVLTAFDPLNELIDHRVYRDNCIVTAEGDHMKDLRIFKGRRMEDTILIDNSTISHLTQPENGVPILPFFDNKKDEELRHLVPFLMSMIGVPDVRQRLRETVKMHVFDKANSVEEAFHHLSN